MKLRSPVISLPQVVTTTSNATSTARAAVARWNFPSKPSASHHLVGLLVGSILLLTNSTGTPAQEPVGAAPSTPPPATGEVERTERATLIDRPPAASATDEKLTWQVRSKRRLVQGERPDWKRQGDELVFDRFGGDGRFDVWTIDVTTHRERCLSCEIYDLRRGHLFNAVWTPDGTQIVAQFQDLAKRIGNNAAALRTPDRTVHSELILLRADGKSYVQLTQAGQLGTTVTDPRFAHEGSALLFAQRDTTRAGGYWGGWSLRLGRIAVKRGVGRLSDPKRTTPSGEPSLLLPQDFFPDDRSVLVAANLDGQGADDMDLYRIELDGGQAQRLTRSRGADDFARYHPRVDWIAFTSAAEAPRIEIDGKTATEVWMMRADGSSKQRLTKLNEDGGLAWAGPLSWSPDGQRLALQVVSSDEPTSQIYLIEVAHQGTVSP